MNKSLRIGILLDSFDVAAWEYSAIEQVCNLDCAEIVLVVLKNSPHTITSTSDKLKQNWHKLSYHLFDKFDRKLFSRQPDAFASKDLRTLVSDVPTIEVQPIQKEYSDSFTAEDVDSIRKKEIDILIRFCSGIIHGEMLNAARFGIWSYHQGDNRMSVGNPPGFWETAENRPVTGSTLQILNETQDGVTVSYRAWFSTYPFSPALNRQLFFWTTTSFLARKIARLHLVGEQQFFDEIQKLNTGANIYDQRLRRIPDNLEMFKIAARLAFRALARLVKGIVYKEQWILMYQFQEGLGLQFHQFKSIIPPPDRYWADPHIIERDGKYTIFFEDYGYKTGKGHIAVIQIDKEGQHSDPTIVLEKDYHLSYPFVFSWQGRDYIIPETAENRTVDLYECIDFPYTWKFKMHLMKDIRSVDNTLLYHGDKWWLFANVATIKGASLNNELFLFFAEDFPSNKWTPHPLNPIISDVRRSRPAGRIFEHNGKLIRPSQDSSRGYGHSFNLNEIITLSETAYKEKTLISVHPDWNKNVIGTHTFQQLGGMTMIDALIRQRRFF